jgi:uncharacterized protein (DUF2141 family)
MSIARLGVVLGSAFLLGAESPVETGSLDVVITNVRAATGRVHVDICTEVNFLMKCPRAFDSPAHAGTTVVTATNLPSGAYAAQVYYDQNGNGKIDRALFGIPVEGVGFSNDAPINLAPPKYAAAMFRYTAPKQTITLKLRYFTGKQF